jgi:hypothetical protein
MAHPRKTRTSKSGGDKPVITLKRKLFVKEYLIDLKPKHAALRAGYAENAAAQAAYEMLQLPEVQALIDEEMAARAKRLEISQDDVLRRLWDMARADARELMEYRRLCCRYCWGKGFGYQRTKGEMDSAREAWTLALANATAAKRKTLGKFDEKGGVGFHAKKDPNPACPECFGDGVGSTFVHDTRNVSPEAARLYAGVKQTKDGLEIKTHAQDAALVNVGRHLGMFKDKVEHSGPDGKPLPAAQVAPIFNITLSTEE